jgi:hypothetical protein
MKHVFCILILLMPLLVFSQRFQGGIVAGFNASQIDGDYFYGYNKAGLMGGAFVFTEFKDKWKGQMEIRYSAKGSATNKDNIEYQKNLLRYIEVPLIIEYKIFKKVQLQAGASIGYLFYAKQDIGSGYEDYEKKLKPMETAICAGLNASFLDPLNFNIRYSYSLFPVYENYPLESYGTRAWFNNVITFGIYYRIGRKYN